MSWDIVIIGFVCTCIGLWAGWEIYHGKVGLLRMEIKALKRELSDERERGEAYGKAADEWRGAAMRADAEVGRLKHEKDAEIAGLKQKLDDVPARVYAESVDTWIRERRLKRALYKACANWAHEKDDRYYLKYVCISDDDARIQYERWRKMERKCRAKAEEYK